MSALVVPRLGRAHTPGLSVAEFDVEPGGTVEAQLTFASAEPLAGTPLRDEDLRAFVLDGVDVAADGARCSATFRGSEITENDALVLRARYACAPHPGAVEVTLYYLSALRPGHREIARIVAPGASAEAVLRSDRRALSLELPGGKAAAAARARRARKGRQIVALTAAFTAAMLALFVWRWRATRRR